MDIPVIVIMVVVAALVFDFTNGFHDTANAMATSIATGALRPRVAVAIAGVLNLAGAFVSVQVAKTISGGLVDEAIINPVVDLRGADRGHPVEPSHLAGRTTLQLVARVVRRPDRRHWVASGVGAVQVAHRRWQGHPPRRDLATARRRCSPSLPRLLAFRVTAAADAAKVRRGFRVGQVVSASTVALAHGANDAQKTMGVITLTLITAGLLTPGSAPPFWVVLAAGVAIGAGTYMGGWRIIRTLGRRITRHPGAAGLHGRDDQCSGDPDLHPLRHTAVHHAGLHRFDLRRRSRSQVGRRCTGGSRGGWSWPGAVTMPASALVGAATSYVAANGTGRRRRGRRSAASAAGLGIYAASRRNPVSAINVNDVAAPSPARAVA